MFKTVLAAALVLSSHAFAVTPIEVGMMERFHSKPDFTNICLFQANGDLACELKNSAKQANVVVGNLDAATNAKLIELASKVELSSFEGSNRRNTARINPGIDHLVTAFVKINGNLYVFGIGQDPVAYGEMPVVIISQELADFLDFAFPALNSVEPAMTKASLDFLK